jgi:hypothetical protein
MGPLEFLAGFGQERRRVKAAEVGIDMQQGRAMSQGIAGAGQGIARGISQGALARFQADQQTTQQGARAAMLRGLQQQRTQGTVYQDAVDAYIKAGGAPGQPPPGIEMEPPAPAARAGAGPVTAGAPVMPPATAGVMGPPAPPAVPQPAAPEPGGVPLPVIKPSAIGQYRKQQEKLALYEKYAATIQTDPYMPEEQKARELARLAQVIAPVRAFLDQHPEPKPPRTYEELASAGPLGGGFTPIPGTYNYAIPDGKGGIKVSTAVHPKEDMGWMTIPDPVKRSEAKRAHLEDHRVMLDDDEYLWDGKKWDKQKQERDEFDSLAYAQKRLATQNKDTGKFPTADQVVGEITTIRTGLELFELQQAVQEAPDADAILNIIKQRAHISPENHERLFALNNADMVRPLRPAELQERAELAAEWLDAMMAMKDAGVQIPPRLKAELFRQHQLLTGYVAAGRRP